jgi:hypothetical protein
MEMHPRANIHHSIEGIESTVWTATGHERPVFLDDRGRRRRWVLAGGVIAGAASGFWFAALIAGAIGFSTLPSMRASVPVFAQRTLAHDIAGDERHRHVVLAFAGGRRQSLPVGATGSATGARPAITGSVVTGSAAGRRLISNE